MDSFAWFDSPTVPTIAVRFDSTQEVVSAFVKALQKSLAESTDYQHLFVPPQVNVMFAPDAEVAGKMIAHMSAKLTNEGMFEEDEIRFIRKPNGFSDGSQRIRLEFTAGVTVQILHKIIAATIRLA